MTIGPSNCGKSYLSENILMPFFQGIGVHAKYLSSDHIRRDVLGQSLHKHDFKMMAASKGAFSILQNNLKEYTSYPVNIPVIIVDATNLSKTGRSFILDIAEKNHYNLVGLFFDYKDTDDYFKYVDETTDKRVIYDMVKTLKKTTEREIDKSKFKGFYKIESIDFSEIEFSYTEGGSAGHYVAHENVCVVADLHGCYDEFLNVLQDNKGLTIDFDQADGIPKLNYVEAAINAGKYIHHVLVGDIVDKGPEEGVKKLVKFLHKNADYFTIVEGNHDRWNYNFLKGRIKIRSAEQELIDTVFDSVTLFKGDEEMRKIFFELYEKMHTFAYNEKFIVTHAPCQNKYLGKTDKVSLKQMNTIRYPKTKDYESAEAYMDAKEKFFHFLIEESEGNFPVHFFGHVDLKSVFQNKNKYGIDTGCVAGNSLSTAIFMKENKKPFIRKYKSLQPVTKELSTLFRTRRNVVEFGSLDIDVQKRLRWLARNKVNFVSGTMSPSDKDFEENDLESLAKGLEYFKNAGVKEVILQPKFMGSRANFYMQNPLIHGYGGEGNTIISRNGYTINAGRLKMTDEQFTELITNSQKAMLGLFEAKPEVDMYILDGELLPWNVMGRELIERDFNLAYKACSSELDILESTGFEELMTEMLSKNTLINEDSKPHEKSAKASMDAFVPEMLTNATMRSCLAKYRHQLDVFGSDAPAEFKPFAILKTIKTDGTESNWINSEVDNINVFSMLASDTFQTINFETENYLETAQLFWDGITGVREMEGLVIKPRFAYVPGVAPYMKVRNKEYLRLTYGFEYDALAVKKEKLIKNKSIRRKLETSIKEYELGRMALNVKRSDISIDNQDWLSTMVQLISEQDREKELDPRL